MSSQFLSLADETVEVVIKSLGGLGNGIGTYRNKPVFVAKSCVGDMLKLRITKENQHGLRGEIAEILTPGPARQTSPCQHYDQCGGCTLQHMSEESYRALKTNMLQSALSYAGFANEKALMRFLGPQTRRRVEFKIYRGIAGPRLAFYKLRSRDPVVIAECPVLDPSLEALIGPLNQMLPHLDPVGAIRSVRVTKADDGLDMHLSLSSETMTLADVEYWCRTLGIARLSARTDEASMRVLYESHPITMQLGAYAIPLPPEAFLQATAEGQRCLTDIAVQALQGCTSVIDLFCGIGTYSFPLSAHAKVHAVEGDAAMVQAMHQAIATYKLRQITCEKRDLFKQPVSSIAFDRFNAALLNPPRLGAKAQIEQIARSRIKTIVMISCNPATFSRDAKLLKQQGFELESVTGIDQFVWSPHLEIASVFRRNTH